jgi:signal transduction histidine kinase
VVPPFFCIEVFEHTYNIIEGAHMNYLSRLLTVFAISFCTLAAVAEERAGPEEAQAMVRKVIAGIKSNGRERVFAEINSLQGQFRDRDLYISVLDLHGNELAHGANKRMQGINILELKDEDGKSFIKERLDMARKQGKGWQDYKFVNPVTKNIELKTVYFERLDDIVINCGAYKAASPKGGS